MQTDQDHQERIKRANGIADYAMETIYTPEALAAWALAGEAIPCGGDRNLIRNCLFTYISAFPNPDAALFGIRHWRPASIPWEVV